MLNINKLYELVVESLLLEAMSLEEIYEKFYTKDIDSLEIKLGKKLSIATDAEITAALESPDMKFVRTKTAKSVYHEKQAMIDSVFSKYDMSKADEASKAYYELQEKGINRALLRGIAKEWKIEK